MLPTKKGHPKSHEIRPARGCTLVNIMDIQICFIRTCNPQKDQAPTSCQTLVSAVGQYTDAQLPLLGASSQFVSG